MLFVVKFVQLKWHAQTLTLSDVHRASSLRLVDK
jgi:hypothetical protein